MQATDTNINIFRQALNPAVVMPAFNEAACIAEVISELRELCDFPVIVVDDASTDTTAQAAAAAGATVLPLINQLGAWGATQAGIRYAVKKGHDAVITVDADGQHDPRHINDLLEPIALGAADVCIGSWSERGSSLRQIAWKLLRATSGMKIEDITSGFRAYNQRALNELAGWRATFLDFQDVGVLSLLVSTGLTITDAPTPMRSRENGHSRIFRTWLVVFYYMCHSLLLGLTKRRIRGYRPYRQPSASGSPS